LGPVLAVDSELGEVVQVEPVERQVVEFVEQERLQGPEEVALAQEELPEPEEVEMALFVAQVEAMNLLNSAAVLEEGGPRVGRAQSNCTGTLEACPLPP